MADARLGIQISADVAGLVTGLQQGSKSVAALESDLLSLQSELKGIFGAEQFSKLNNAIISVKPAFESLSTEAAKVKAELSGTIFPGQELSAFSNGIDSVKDKLASISAISDQVKNGITEGFSPQVIARFDEQLEALKAELATLHSVSINISGKDSGLTQQLENLRNKLAEISTLRVNVNVPVSDFTKLATEAERIKLDIQDLSLNKLSESASRAAVIINDIRSEISTLTANATIGINASDFESAIKRIGDKIASLTDAKLNINADPTRAEAAIRDIVSDINNLRAANIVLKADGTQAIGVIDTIEGQLQSLQANISVDASGIQAKAAEIKEAFGQLNFSANVDVNDSVVNEAVKSINQKLSLLADPTIDFTANPSQAENAIKEINALLTQLRGANVSLSVSGAEAVENFISQIEARLVSVRDAANIPVIFNAEDAKTKIAGLKTQLETISESTKVGIDTAEFDAALKQVQAKIAALDAPDIDLTANPQRVESAIKEITDDLSRLKGSVITLDANGRPAIKSINELEKELAELQQDLKAATNPKDFQNLAKAAALVKEQIRGINTAGISTSLGRVSKSSNEASQTLINLSRIAQDAPFGFIGIANNINPLVESFQRLQLASKQTGTSLLSNLGTAFSGAGGIGLGIGVVSSLLISFGDNLLKSEKNVSSLTLETAKLENQLKSLADGFDDVQKASDFLNRLGNIVVDINFGQGNLKGGLLKIQSEIVQNLFNEDDLKKRLSQVQDIISKTNIFEKLSQKAKDVRDQFGTSDLIPESVISELSEKDQKLIKIEASLLKSFVDFGKKLEESENKRTLLAAQIRLQNVLIKEDEAKKLKELQDKQLADFEKFQNEIISRARAFVKQFGISFEVPDLEESFTNTKDKIFAASRKLLDGVSAGNLKIKIPVQADFEIIPGLNAPAEAPGLAKESIDKLQETFFEELKKAKQQPFIFDPTIQLAINKENAKKLAKTQAEELADSLRSIFTSSFAQIGEDLGNIIASGGGFDNIFKGVFAIIGSGLAALGKQMIAISPVIAGLKAALKSLNPAVLLPAGIALVAIGTALRATVSKGITGFATGGFVRGPGGPKEDKIPAMLSAGEFVINAKSTRENLSLIKLINAGFKFPKFAEGGLFGSAIQMPQTKFTAFNKVVIESKPVYNQPRFRGRDFYLMMNREQRSQRLRR